ncbi:Protocadherin Fat 4 [Manis pentadactyla]|nr:Protocadherin Fat 4 [Manis pentadactyla]
MKPSLQNQSLLSAQQGRANCAAHCSRAAVKSWIPAERNRPPEPACVLELVSVPALRCFLIILRKMSLGHQT